MALLHPELSYLRELRSSLSKMRLSNITVGKDARNRCMLSAFSSKTGRNQPSNSKSIFGPAVWLRSLIKPNPGYGLAYIDWSQQEYGIASFLSKDKLMIEAYQSEDSYLGFAKQVGAVPRWATKDTHKKERGIYKECILAVQYGMGSRSLAFRIGKPVSYAKDLLQLHKDTYRTYWTWSDAVVDHAMLYGKLWTTFGWHLHISGDVNPRSIRNFPMQANGAEMLRIACILADSYGIKIIAPVHDALLIESPIEELESAITTTQKAMAEASAIVLDGHALKTDVSVTRYPDRYQDERGIDMWNMVQDIIKEIKG